MDDYKIWSSASPIHSFSGWDNEHQIHYSSDEQPFKSEIIPIIMPFHTPPKISIASGLSIRTPVDAESCPKLARHYDQAKTWRGVELVSDFSFSWWGEMVWVLQSELGVVTQTQGSWFDFNSFTPIRVPAGMKNLTPNTTNPQTSPPWWSGLPLLRRGIFGYARSDAGDLFRRGWPRAHTLGLI